MPIENQPANNNFGELVKLLSSTYEPNHYSMGPVASALEKRINQEHYGINTQGSILTTVAEILSAETTSNNDIFIAKDGIVVNSKEVLQAQKGAIDAISYNLLLKSPEVLTRLSDTFLLQAYSSVVGRDTSKLSEKNQEIVEHALTH